MKFQMKSTAKAVALGIVTLAASAASWSSFNIVSRQFLLN